MRVSVDISEPLRTLIEIWGLIEFYTGTKLPERAYFLTDYELQGDDLILKLKIIDHHNNTIPDLPPIPLKLDKQDFELLFRDMSDELQRPITLEKLKGALLVYDSYRYTLHFEVEDCL